MPLTRFHRLPAEKKAELFRAAAKHFAEQGFDGASLNEILSEAGLSKSSYYYYFEDKEDLFATTLETLGREALTDLPMFDLDGIAPDLFWPTIEKWAAAIVANFKTRPDLIRLSARLTPALRASPRFAPLLEEARGFYRAGIEAGQRAGCIRTDLPVDSLITLLEACDAALDQIIMKNNAPVTAESLEAHTRLVLDTFQRVTAVTGPSISPAAAEPRS